MNNVIKTGWSLRKISILVAILIYVCLFYYFAKENIYLGFSVVLGLISFPYLINNKQEEGNYLYLVIAALFSVATFTTNSFAIFYLSFVFSLCYLINIFIGKFNLLPFFLLVLISPLISHISAILSFPIRLRLSDWVSQLLSKLGMDISNEGNLLILNGAKFLVDQECVGLNMLLTGLVLSLIVLSYHEKKSQIHFNFIEISFFLLFGFVLNILSNLSRILILVIYRIGPDHFMHDIVGILCLLFFLLAPIIFAVRIYSRYKKAGIDVSSLEYVYTHKPKLVLVAMPIFLLVISNHSRNAIPIQHVASLDLTYFQKFKTEYLPDDIKKFTKGDLLIYVKPPVSPIRGTHDPRFCWRGSGYQLQQIQMTDINSRVIYSGILEKGENRIYTAWWYQDGRRSTPSEWTWRTESLFNSKSYTLLNFNSDSKEILMEEIEQYFISLNDDVVE